MGILETVLERLDAFKYSELRGLAAASGVPLGTLVRIRYRQAKNPRVETIQKLADHFAESQAA